MNYVQSRWKLTFSRPQWRFVCSRFDSNQERRMAGGESSAKRLTVSQITSDVQPRCFQGENPMNIWDCWLTRHPTSSVSLFYATVLFLQAHALLYRVSQCKSDHLKICLIYDCTRNLLREKWSNLKIVGVSSSSIDASFFYSPHRSIKVLVVREDTSFERYFNLNFLKFDVRRGKTEDDSPAFMFVLSLVR